MANNRIRINYKENLDRIDLTSGQFKLLFNIYQNVLGSNTGDRIYITEISPSRTEIKVKLVDDASTTQWDSFGEITDQADKIGNYVANFGNNNTILITNWVYDGNGDLIFKLYEPLFDEFETKSQLWISELIAEQIKDTVIVSEPAQEEDYNVLSAPNFNITVNQVVENDTGFQTWNDVLTTNTDTSNSLIDKYFSQSFYDSAELNIDFSDYDKFVHFGSAQEKLDNFVYKLGLIETYNTRSAVLTDLSASTAITSEISQVELNKRKVINGFDGYEKYLYYESSSNSTIDREYNLSSSTDYTYATSWPKSGSWHSQTLLPTTSSEAIDWYQSQSMRATEFDNLNLHKLINTIPNYIKYDVYNDEYILFVNMMGHFFDNIWTYINGFNDLYTRENDISLGLSKDLIYDSLEALGIKLNSGNNLIDLWKYEFGYDSTGSYLNTGSEFKSISNKNITVEIWNRILNNLPYLLKTKGTKRGIQALVTCYGIPSTILDIYEYGGPSETGSDWNTERQIEVFDYSLGISGSEYITGSWPGNIDTAELRINFSSAYNTKEDRQSIFKVGTTEIYVSKSGTDGVIIASDSSNIMSSSELRLFDGDFWNIMLLSGSTNQLYVKKYKDGEMIYSSNASNALFSLNDFATAGSFTLGSGSSDIAMQEVRFWNSPITENDFIEHAKSPKSIRITDGSPYDNLEARYAFDSPANLNVSTSIYDSRPNQVGRNIITASGYSSTTSYPYNYTATSSMATPLMPSIGYNVVANKTRVENNYLLTSMSLQPDVRSEVRAYDYAPLDSPRVGVFFSLTNLINERIVEVYSNTNYDDYIGDPADKFKNYYPKLREINEDFWEKYAPTMSFNDYLSYIKHYDMSLFDTIRDNLPARAQKQVGVLIEPHILQRSRVPITPNPTWEDLYHSGSISAIKFQLTDSEISSYNTLTSGSEFKATVNAEFLTYYCSDTGSAKVFTTELPNIYMSFTPWHILSNGDIQSFPTGSLIMPPMVYPKCSFMTASGYTPYSSSDSSSLFYSENNYVLNSDRSLGFLRPRYIGCLQTIYTTLDGKAPVEISITSDNKLITQDGGDINLIVR